MSSEDSLIGVRERSLEQLQEKASTTAIHNDTKVAKKRIPPVLKIENTEESGEKSPKARTLLELFKNHNIKKAKRKAQLAKKEVDDKVNEDTQDRSSDVVNIEFDKMSSDEKDGFLRKLSLLSVNKTKKTPPPTQKVEDGGSTSAARFFRKLTSRRTESTGKSNADSPNKHRSDGFGRSQKLPLNKETDNIPRKHSARRLDFYAAGDNINCDNAENNQKNKVVAAMTREYEKLVLGKPQKLANLSNRPSRYQSSMGLLDSPNENCREDVYSCDSTPVKSSYSCQDTSRSVSTGEDHSPRKSKNNYRVYQRDGSSNASWHGELPPRDYTSPTFSRKIFVGGVPWDITECALKESFGEFGTCAVEWPGQEARYRSGQASMVPNGIVRPNVKIGNQTATGYVYMIFEDERAVASLLHECSQEIGGAGEWYFKIRAQRSKSTEIRQVQIIPWVTSDSLHCDDETILDTGIEPKRTVFVGALHGMMTAQVLYSIMEECFGGVECVQLDTDKFKYPIGSGRVTFLEHNAYFKAIEIGYLNVHTSKFRKRVQIDPFLESTVCMVCSSESAHCFCRNRNCFKYYCNTCWAVDHSKDSTKEVHIPVIVPSSATKSYQATGTRRSSNLLIGSSPVKSSISAPNQTINSHQFSQFIGHGAVVLSPTPTLSAVYGYMNVDGSVQPTQNTYIQPTHGQFFDANQAKSSQSDTTVRRGRPDRTVSMSSVQSSNAGVGTLYINTAMTPKKNPSPDEHMSPNYYASPNPNYVPTTFLSPTAFYAPTNGSGNCMPNQQPQSATNNGHTFYGGNVYYGYVSQPGPINGNTQFFYDANGNVYNSPTSTSAAPYVCATNSSSYH